MEISIEARGLTLPALLECPEDASGWVIFAHGSGSSRLSPRNHRVARALNRAGLGTLLFDLLTLEESEDRERVFDIGLLTERLHDATAWLYANHVLRHQGVGYFGASTGAAAALRAAAEPWARISGVISRGGRADLARADLERVSCPALLIVGENDDWLLETSKRMLPLLSRGELMVIPGATHLFEEPGALDLVQKISAYFFLKNLGARVRQTRYATG